MALTMLPALATADVGIAFADSTTAAAASAADAIVLKEGGDHISSLPYIFRVAKKTKTIMKQNIALAMVSIVGASSPPWGATSRSGSPSPCTRGAHCSSR